jgi:hypothetical protein
MKVLEVGSARQEKIFIQIPAELYRGNPFWIRPLDKDIRAVFDPARNVVAKNGISKRWLLQHERGEFIGRIAAFVNPKIAYSDSAYPVGGMGFFECIDDQAAANLLFDTAANWLKEQGMEAMEGPINFGEREKFWGLLTDGFDREPNYLANYHFPYYRELFEHYGFRCYFNQFTYSFDKYQEFSPEYLEKAESVLQNPEFDFRHLRKKELEKYTEDFRIIYNKAWAKHLGVSEMSSRKAKTIIHSLKPVLDEKTAWFGYHLDQPIAFFIMIPEVNQIFKYVDGKLNTWGKLVYLYHVLRQNNTKLLGIAFGVIPEFDGKGVTNAITLAARNRLLHYKHYEVLEMHGIGDFNPAMLKFVHKIGEVEKVKVHTTYRFLFDRNRPFERMPMKEYDRNDTEN